jgi:acyl-CoA thioesterase I
MLKNFTILFVLLINFMAHFFSIGLYACDITSGNTELMDAVIAGDKERIRNLLLNGANPVHPRQDGLDAIDLAQQQDGYIKNILVNWQDFYGETPLIAAIFKGNKSLVEKLLAYGADPVMMKFDRATPSQFVQWRLEEAARVENSEVEKDFIRIKEILKTSVDNTKKTHFPVYNKFSVAAEDIFAKFPIVATGDSLTEGVGSPVPYSLMLSRDLSLPIVNTGVGGNTTKDLLDRLEPDILAYKPSIILMTIGGNDIMKALSERDFSYLNEPRSTTDNLRLIFKHIRTRNAKTEIILGLITPGGPMLTHLEQNLPLQVRDLLPSMINSWTTAIKNVAVEYNVTIVDSLLDAHWADNSLLVDDIHPNERGYRLLRDKFRPALDLAVARIRSAFTE